MPTRPTSVVGLDGLHRHVPARRQRRRRHPGRDGQLPDRVQPDPPDGRRRAARRRRRRRRRRVRPVPARREHDDVHRDRSERHRRRRHPERHRQLPRRAEPRSDRQRRRRQGRRLRRVPDCTRTPARRRAPSRSTTSRRARSPSAPAVAISNALVTGVGANGFFIQVKETDDAATPARRQLAACSCSPAPARRMLAMARSARASTSNGSVDIFYGEIELDSLTAVTVDAVGPETRARADRRRVRRRGDRRPARGRRSKA